MTRGHRTALIGYTGFVGTTLLRSCSFDDVFRSTTIRQIEGREYDLVICAGVSAAKWIANRDPEGDRASIAKLTASLGVVRTREFILISTIDVYPHPASGEDESAAIDPVENHAYGRNRYELEQWVGDRFPLVRIVRLPALFGEGLRKNTLFDLLNNKGLDQIHPLGEFQWYPVVRLSHDIARVRDADLRLVNLFPPPLETNEITSAFFPASVLGKTEGPAPRYDLRTRHNFVLGGGGGYISDRITVLGEMAHFIGTERRRIDARSETPGA
ncbi:MAG: NAD(P)-dependent oxidoreductase [Gemmatimonadetes bacterium]|nr:NAD(P)-dependent oxidoreductase [Gemmatimonadota bacterium]